MIISDLNYMEVVAANNIEGGAVRRRPLTGNTASAIAASGSVAVGKNTYTAAGTFTVTKVAQGVGSASASGSIAYATAQP